METNSPALTADAPLGGQASTEFRIVDHAIDGETTFAERAEPVVWNYLSPAISEVTIGDRRHPMRVYHCGDLRMIAPGAPCSRLLEAPATLREATLPRAAFTRNLGETAGAELASCDRLQRFTFRSELIQSLIERLRAASRGPQLLGPLYCDALLGAIVAELWRLSGAQDPAPEPSRTGLCPRDLRRIDAFIDAETTAKIELSDLAEIVRMPPAVFQRAFKKATGRTPYQHALARRLDQARELILRTELPLAEIAYRTGFSSQSHMTDMFKAKHGVTPGKLRKEAR